MGKFIELRNIRVQFPGVLALAGVSLDVGRGEVTALVGQNGAGKSTLVSVLAGLRREYHGDVLIGGERIELRTPRRARECGIALVEQELSLVPELSVAENIFLGRLPKGWIPGFYRRDLLNERAQATLETLAIDLPLGRPVRDLSPAQAQIVEIAKALSKTPKLLIFDEPTSSLTKPEADKLLLLIRRLRAEGTAILYVSHKLTEVLAIADFVAVLRDGRKVAMGPAGQWREEGLIQAIVGRDRSQVRHRSPNKLGEVVLSAKSLSVAGSSTSIDIDLRAGEIVGMAGLIGAGRTELAEALFGLRPARAGTIFVNGRKAKISSPRAALKEGIGLVPEDRRKHGIIAGLTTLRNISLATLPKYCKAQFVARSRERSTVASIARQVGLDVQKLPNLAETLSGGNKQKSIIAKMLLLSPAVLILDEPTRGIDVGAKAEIYELIGKLTEKGTAVLLISSEMTDLLGLCDRILVMREGRLVAEFDGQSANEESLMTAAALDVAPVLAA